jgi:hypothetical protein
MDTAARFTLVVPREEQAVARQMESLLIAFVDQEDQRLAANMLPREISVAADEAFHPEICWVGTEPVSDFILLESYQPPRRRTTDQGTSGHGRPARATRGLPRAMPGKRFRRRPGTTPPRPR